MYLHGMHGLRRIHRIKRILAVLAVCLLTGLPAVRSTAAPAYTRKSLAGYADLLLAEGDYYRAITETYRYAYLFPTAQRSLQLDLHLGNIYYDAGRYDLALRHYLNYEESVRKKGLELANTKVLVARTYAAREDYNNALNQLNSLPRTPEMDEEELFRLELKKAEYFIKYYRKDYPRPLDAISTNRGLMEKYSSELSLLAEKQAEAPVLRRKSATAAGFLSVIPGANMFYVGRYKDGALSFLAHSGLITLTVFCARRKDYVSAAFFGLTELSWYVYGFTAGREAVRDYNLRQISDFRRSFTLDIELRF